MNFLIRILIKETIRNYDSNEHFCLFKKGTLKNYVTLNRGWGGVKKVPVKCQTLFEWPLRSPICIKLGY